MAPMHVKTALFSPSGERIFIRHDSHYYSFHSSIYLVFFNTFCRHTNEERVIDFIQSV